MSEWGSFFGWLIVVGLVFTLCNYPVKVVYRKWIAALPGESGVKKTYQSFQKIIVRYHRFFALFASAMLITHVTIQWIYRWVSWTGLLAAGLVVVTSTLGGYGHYVKKKRRSGWFYVHRTLAVLVIAAIAVHIFL